LPLPRRFSLFIRLLGWLALAVYLAVAALVLGIRYWVLPHIDQWRPVIAEELGRAVGVPVRLGNVQAQWNGLDPTFVLSNVDLTSPRGKPILHLPQMRARLSWRSILDGVPRFALLEARGIDLTVRRSRRNEIWVMGQRLALDTASASMASADLTGLAWLATQRRIRFTDGTVRWVDESRGAAPLVLRRVTLVFENQGASHEFSLSAALPEGLGSDFDLRGIFSSGARPAAFSLQGLSGRMYARVDGVDTRSWSPWLDLSPGLDLKQVGAQAWATVENGAIDRVASVLNLDAANWSQPPDTDVAVGQSSLYVAGAWPTLRQVFFPGPAVPAAPGPAVSVAPTAGYPPFDGVQFRLSAKALAVRSDPLFTQALGFDAVAVRGVVSRDEKQSLHVAVDQASVRNPDMDVAFSGTWHQGGDGEAGIADAHGVFHRAALAAIEHYLPRSLNQDAHDWMRKGLVAGDIHEARFVLRGDLDHFPFGTRPDKGDFLVRGTYSGAVVDYAPAHDKRPGWPALTDMSGEIALHRVDLRMVAGTATMTPVDGQPPIRLSDVQAQIPDLEGESILTVQSDTQAPAMSYLGLMRHSPLGALLDHTFDDARADGTWQVPLRLTIPLRHVVDTLVRGGIQFDGGTVAPLAGVPPFTHVAGELLFSETGVGASGLNAQFMGGEAAFSGGFSPGEHRLLLKGTMQARALGDYVGVEGMARLTGHLAYRAALERQKSGRYELTLDSDLKGLAVDLPAPFGKQAEGSLPLHAVWGPHGRTMALTATLGKDASLFLVHRSGKGGPLFESGYLGVGAPEAAPPARGLDMAVAYPKVDVDQWRRIYDAFSTPAHGAAAWKTQVFPDLRQLRLESPHVTVAGLDLDKVRFTMVPALADAQDDWRMTLDSTQSTGTALWREATKEQAGSIVANFQRLSLGRADDEKTGAEAQAGASKEGASKDDSSWTAHGKVDIPEISLQAEQFVLYGRDLGKLSAHGVNQARGELWKLDKLHLSSPSLTLDGTGQWRLSGLDRGLSLRAKADVTNLGNYLDRIGFKNIMRNGRGTLSGQLFWHNLPWAYEKSDLNGQFDITLRKGSFRYEDSRTARLLKLLSLQSVSRLAKFEWNPLSALKNGFPYDDIRGTVKMENGVLKTDNYRVVGPVGTIVLSGTTDMNTEKLDMQALVIPNLDVSGAAIAAGIAINPVVGIGAFLAQWLLRAPLAKAMAVEYRIGGNWDDPVITAASVKSAPGATPAGNATGQPGGSGGQKEASDPARIDPPAVPH
jgi:uncharacterized protein (TIGR02099 family)